MARNDPQVNLRIPASLKAELDSAARGSNRSLTAEIVSRLEDSLGSRQENEPKVLYVILDHDGLPTSWSEIMTQLSMLIDAADLKYDAISAAVVNAEILSDRDRDDQWFKLRKNAKKVVAKLRASSAESKRQYDEAIKEVTATVPPKDKP